MSDRQQYFHDLQGALFAGLRGAEICTCTYEGEQSDFVRFNHARVRQAGHVEQGYLSLHLVQGQRHATAQYALSGEISQDTAAGARLIGELRETLAGLPDDPLLLINHERSDSLIERASELPSCESMVESIVGCAADSDLVGFLASGPLQRGFGNSLGQSNWHEVANFNFEWSLYHTADKATKHAYAGFEFEPRTLAARMARAHDELALLARAPKVLEPGSYRVYLAPAALGELVGLLNWGGFSEKARRTHQSPLQRLVEGKEHLSALVTLSENTAEGIAPAFQSDGFARPGEVRLIENGSNVSALVSPRSAREYGIEHNGADTGYEAALSIDMAGGDIDQASVLAALDTGLYVNNLWYLNFSDRVNCRITGMTRFATFWVEHGRIVAPCAVMRFDDDIYRLLGSELVGLTRQRDFLPDGATYQQRQTVSQRLPGALIDQMRFTL